MRYHSPASFPDASAIAAGASGVTRFLAGGTDVLVQMRAGAVRPDDLIDLKKIPGVGSIEKTADGGWTIGVGVPGIALGANAALKAEWPGVVEGMELAKQWIILLLNEVNIFRTQRKLSGCPDPDPSSSSSCSVQ